MVKSHPWFFIAVFVTTLALSCSASKVYVPKAINTPPRTGFLKGQTIDLALFDGRLSPEESEELIAQIRSVLVKTYPSATFQSSAFYEDGKPGRITIKISIADYAAGFGRDVKVGVGSVGGEFSYGVIPEGKWNGVTGLSVNILDKRDGADRKVTKDIAKVVSKGNMWGYRTAKAALNESYQSAVQELLRFFDSSLMR